MIRFASIVLLALAGTTIIPAISAQQPGEAPRLLLNSGGAAQPLRSLRFSPDGTRLYAAGDHKCVHVWRIAGQPLPPSLESSLQWGISRANLGRIYAMDLAPNGRKLVVGGYSIRNRGGDLTLFSVPDNLFDKPLPAADRPEDNMSGSGHVTRVNGTSFSLDGQRLATIGGEGDILVWSVAAGTIVERVAPRAAQPISDASRQAPIMYLANNTIVAPTQRLPLTNPVEWSLAVFETGKPVRSLLADDGKLVTLARDPAGQKWASLHQVEPHVRVWDQNGQQTRTIRSTRARTQPSGLALGTGNLVLVTERQFPQNVAGTEYFNQSAPTWLQLWDSGPAEPSLIDEIQVSNSPTPISCAISSDGRWAATVAGDGEDIWLFPLLDAQGARVAKPLSEQQPILMRGRGMPFWKVAFEETASGNGKYRIGIGVERKPNLAFNNYGDVSREFDLVGAQYIPRIDPASRWRTPNSGAPGWEVLLPEGPDQGTRLQLRNNGQNVGEIRLHPENQGRCISYCWLPQAAGRTPALALGMSGETAGIFVYELTNPAQPRLVRYYRDHQHWVTSLSVSRDGKYLASASRDQMIKIWSLAGLFDHPARFPNACAWGAEFVPEGNQLVVQNVQAAGIVASRGLKAGDVIKTVNRKPVTNPQATASYLNDRPIWETQGLIASGVRDGKALVFEEFAITPAWEPLESLFVDRNQEWAIWTPRGYYEASAEGDKLFGWLVNRKRSEAPLFYRSDQLRQDMERPDVIKSLLLAGNHDGAMRAGGEQARIPVTNPVTEIVINKMPSLRITSPANKAHFTAGQPVSIQAEATFPTPAAANAFRPEAYLNRSPLPPPVIRQGPGKVFYTWAIPAAKLSPENYVQVKLLGGPQRVTALYVDAVMGFTADIQPVRRRMYFLGMSAQKYPNPDVYPSLGYPHADVNALKGSLEARQGVHYDLDSKDISHLQDSDITPKAIQERIGSLTDKLASRGPDGSNDLLVIAISGHGDRVKSATGFDYFFITPHPGIKTDGDADQLIADRGLEIRKYAISWDLLAKIAEVPCKKVFILDTCHSGAIGEDQTTKNAARSLGRLEAFVMTSAGATEKSWEGGKYKQGVFTYCLLQGLQGLADGVDAASGTRAPDQEVDLFELAAYVRTHTPGMAEQLSGFKQTPRFLPGSFEPAFRIPLVRVEKTRTVADSP